MRIGCVSFGRNGDERAFCKIHGLVRKKASRVVGTEKGQRDVQICLVGHCYVRRVDDCRQRPY